MLTQQYLSGFCLTAVCEKFLGDDGFDLLGLQTVLLFELFQVGDAVRVVNDLEVQRFGFARVMVVPNDIAHLFNQRRLGTQSLPGA